MTKIDFDSLMFQDPSQTKRQARESSELSVGKASAPLPATPRGGGRGPVMATAGDAASPKPSAKLHTEAMKAPDRSTPAASPRKRGRPKKDGAKEDKGETGTAADRSSPAASGSPRKWGRPRKDGGEESKGVTGAGPDEAAAPAAAMSGADSEPAADPSTEKNAEACRVEGTFARLRSFTVLCHFDNVGMRVTEGVYLHTGTLHALQSNAT